MLEYGIYIALKYANVENQQCIYSCKHKRLDMLHFERIEREFDYQKANPIGNKARL